ncbi:MAG: hypothetical protein ACTSYL_06280 [Candidatus Thorarchaeota archaeon]
MKIQDGGTFDHKCGMCSCIAVYYTKTCAFCDSAYDMVVDMLQKYGVPETAISKIDVEQGCSCGCANLVQGVPTIRICNESLVGIPDEDLLHDAVLRILMNECFRS